MLRSDSVNIHRYSPPLRQIIIINKTGSASVLMAQYDVSYEIMFSTSYSGVTLILVS